MRRQVTSVVQTSANPRQRDQARIDFKSPPDGAHRAIRPAQRLSHLLRRQIFPGRQLQLGPSPLLLAAPRAINRDIVDLLLERIGSASACSGADFAAAAVILVPRQTVLWRAGALSALLLIFPLRPMPDHADFAAAVPVVVGTVAVRRGLLTFPTGPCFSGLRRVRRGTRRASAPFPVPANRPVLNEHRAVLRRRRPRPSGSRPCDPCASRRCTGSSPGLAARPPASNSRHQSARQPRRTPRR